MNLQKGKCIKSAMISIQDLINEIFGERNTEGNSVIQNIAGISIKDLRFIFFHKSILLLYSYVIRFK